MGNYFTIFSFPSLLNRVSSLGKAFMYIKCIPPFLRGFISQRKKQKSLEVVSLCENGGKT